MEKNAVCILCCNATGNDYISHSSSGAGIRGADEKVDGSYLTMQESASGTSQNEDAKGQYIMLGECSITKAGRNRIYVYSGTTARTTVNLVSTIIYVDRYNAEKDAWGQIAGWSKDAENDYLLVLKIYHGRAGILLPGTRRFILQVCSIHMRVHIPLQTEL